MTIKRTGNTLFLPNGEKLLICTRPESKRTRTKGELYLLKVSRTGKRTYFSSLWGTAPDFELEYQGVRYILTLTGIETVTLKAKNGKDRVLK
jgi:hypothetical protein